MTSVDCENCEYFFDCGSIIPYDEMTYPDECNDLKIQDPN